LICYFSSRFLVSIIKRCDKQYSFGDLKMSHKLTVIANNDFEKETLEWAFDGWQDTVDYLNDTGSTDDRKEFGNVEWDGTTLSADDAGFDDILYRIDIQLSDMTHEQTIEKQKEIFPKLKKLVKRMDKILSSFSEG
jgi:hypothetical protein